MENQIFQWKRFVAALRKEVVENWRTLLFSAIGIYGVLALFMILGNIIHGDDDFTGVIKFRYTFVYIVFSFGGIIVASLAFRGLKTKTGRIELLTSPSSTFEKFLVNTVIYVLGFIVAFPICAQLADLARILILLPWGGEFDVPGPINFLNTIHQFASQEELWDCSTKVWLEVGMYVGALAAPGLYLLGSILWPRLSFLKTFAALYAVEFVVLILAMIGILMFTDMQSFVLWYAEHITSGVMMMCFSIFAIVQLVIYWAVAWWLWRRKDVISLKWWS
jgi:hypothetical protein